MGPVARHMLRELSECPNGEMGFREVEISQSAIRHGWVRYVWKSGRVTFYAITEAGREAYTAKINHEADIAEAKWRS